jgi:hypothetical protein
MTDTGIKELASAWAIAQATPEPSDDRAWQHVFAVQRLRDDKPEILWQFILQVLELEPPESVRGMLAAGPLEDLIYGYGATFIDRIAQEAERNPAFADLLPGVWLSASDDPVTLRFVELGCDIVQAAV